jgi:hypothetical protein
MVWHLKMGDHVLVDHHNSIDEETRKILELRGEFSKRYCEERGWDMANITFDQILEIRKQPEWKDPLNKEGNHGKLVTGVHQGNNEGVLE